MIFASDNTDGFSLDLEHDGLQLCVWFSMIVLLYHAFEFMTGVKSHHAPCGNRNVLSCFGITPRTWRLVAQLEVAEAR
jgi:hypothetical protein